MTYLGTYDQWLIEVAEKIANGFRIGLVPDHFGFGDWYDDKFISPEYYL